MTAPAVIAIDWSGAKRPNRNSGIWLACAAQRSTTREPGRSARVRRPSSTSSAPNRRSSRASTSRSGSRRGSRSTTAARRSTTCGRSPHATASDWLDAERRRSGSERCDVPREQRFRQCEARCTRARSRCSSSSATGRSAPGSVRGMPLLQRLRDAGDRDLALRPPGRPHRRSRSTRRRSASSRRGDDSSSRTNDERDARRVRARDVGPNAKRSRRWAPRPIPITASRAISGAAPAAPSP